MFAQQQPLAHRRSPGRHMCPTCCWEKEGDNSRKAGAARGCSGPPVARQGLSLAVGRNPDAEVPAGFSPFLETAEGTLTEERGPRNPQLPTLCLSGRLEKMLLSSRLRSEGD